MPIHLKHSMQLLNATWKVRHPLPQRIPCLNASPLPQVLNGCRVIHSTPTTSSFQDIPICAQTTQCATSSIQHQQCPLSCHICTQTTQHVAATSSPITSLVLLPSARLSKIFPCAQTTQHATSSIQGQQPPLSSCHLCTDHAETTQDHAGQTCHITSANSRQYAIIESSPTTSFVRPPSAHRPCGDKLATMPCHRVIANNLPCPASICAQTTWGQMRHITTDSITCFFPPKCATSSPTISLVFLVLREALLTSRPRFSWALLASGLFWAYHTMSAMSEVRNMLLHPVLIRFWALLGSSGFWALLGF
jgi:hypothetical protein